MKTTLTWYFMPRVAAPGFSGVNFKAHLPQRYGYGILQALPGRAATDTQKYTYSLIKAAFVSPLPTTR